MIADSLEYQEQSESLTKQDQKNVSCLSMNCFYEKTSCVDFG